MNEPPSELAGITSKIEKLMDYSHLDEVKVRVYYPANQDQLTKIFEYAREPETNRRLTFRGGGHSFDCQSLGNDIVVSMARFNHIDDVAPDNTLTVGAGATWGEIVKRLQPLGVMPRVTVTTENATAGGTLAGDCLSRFSPAFGKEGEAVVSFDFMSLDGTVRTFANPRLSAYPANRPWDERAFYGIVAGLGYLGAVIKIKYDVLRLIPSPRWFGIRTTAEKFEGFAGLAEKLVPATQTICEEDSNPNDPTKTDAIYSALYASRRGGRQDCVLFKSRVTTNEHDRKLKPNMLFLPKKWWRVPLEWAMRRPLLASLGWRLIYFRSVERKSPYCNELDDYTFFMDGNARAKRIGRKLGFKMQNIQQSFVVPFDPATKDWEDGKKSLTDWLEHANEVFGQAKIAPTMWDVLFLPKDECFLLSATAEKPGFVVSSAFETSSKRRLKRAMAAFRKLSDDLERDYHGHVYLVKNVRANPTTLATMYGQYAESFFKLKSELDPTCVFRNKFLDETFGGMLLCGGAPPTVAAPVTEEREPVAEPRFAPATEEERQEEREAAPER